MLLTKLLKSRTHSLANAIVMCNGKMEKVVSYSSSYVMQVIETKLLTLLTYAHHSQWSIGHL